MLTVAEIKKNGLRVALNLSSTPLGEYTASSKPRVALQTLQSLNNNNNKNLEIPESWKCFDLNSYVIRIRNMLSTSHTDRVQSDQLKTGVGK